MDIAISMSVIYFALNTQGLDQNTIGLRMIISTLACPFDDIKSKQTLNPVRDILFHVPN